MATVNITLDVNAETFEKLCVDGINNLPQEQLNEILLKTMEKALIQDKQNSTYNQNSNLLVVRKENDYKYEPTELMKQIIKNIDYDKYLGGLADEVAQYVKDNYSNIVKDAVTQCFSDMLFSQNKMWEMMQSMQNNIKRNC